VHVHVHDIMHVQARSGIRQKRLSRVIQAGGGEVGQKAVQELTAAAATCWAGSSYTSAKWVRPILEPSACSSTFACTHAGLLVPQGVKCCAGKCAHVNAHIHALMYPGIHILVHTTRMHTRTHVHTRIHTCTHTFDTYPLHPHPYTHTHTHLWAAGPRAHGPPLCR